MTKLLWLLLLFLELVTLKNNNLVKLVKSTAVHDEAADSAISIWGGREESKSRHDDSTVGALVCLCVCVCVGVAGCMASFTAA